MKVAYTAMASVTQVDQARAQATNMLANVSTVGFKESYRHPTASVKVGSTAFATTYQPVMCMLKNHEYDAFVLAKLWS